MRESARFDIDPAHPDADAIQAKIIEWVDKVDVYRAALDDFTAHYGEHPLTRGALGPIVGLSDHGGEVPDGWARFKKNHHNGHAWFVPVKGPEGDEHRARIEAVGGGFDLASYLGLRSIVTMGHWYDWGYGPTDGNERGGNWYFAINADAVTPEALAAAKVELPGWLRRLVAHWQPA